jgi:DNA-binding MarR family transcriptional regulator
MTRQRRKADRSLPPQEAPGASRGADERTSPLGELVTMRMIGFFNVLRRSGILTSRRQFDLSEIEWRIMTQVGRHAPLTLNRLSELTLQDRGQLSRAVKGMVERDLLTRERKPGGPEVEIELSKQGRALYARMAERAIERDRHLTGDISQEDLETLRRIIDLMHVKAEELLEAERELAPRSGPAGASLN